jgi:hypothetical protein
MLFKLTFEGIRLTRTTKATLKTYQASTGLATLSMKDMPDMVVSATVSEITKSPDMYLEKTILISADGCVSVKSSKVSTSPVNRSGCTEAELDDLFGRIK